MSKSACRAVLGVHAAQPSCHSPNISRRVALGARLPGRRKPNVLRSGFVGTPGGLWKFTTTYLHDILHPPPLRLLPRLFKKVAPATGTVVRGGLNYREALYVAEACAETGCLGSMDIVEVNADLAEASAAAETVQLGLVAVASAMGSRIL